MAVLDHTTGSLAWAVAGLAGVLAALSGWLYFRGLGRMTRDNPPGRSLGRRVAFALTLSAVTAGVVWVAVDRGEYCYAPEEKITYARERLVESEMEVRRLERERPGTLELERARDRLQRNRHALSVKETANIRVWGCGLLSALFVLGCLAAWVVGVGLLAKPVPPPIPEAQTGTAAADPV
jgi:hypothetical protein